MIFDDYIGKVSVTDGHTQLDRLDISRYNAHVAPEKLGQGLGGRMPSAPSINEGF